MRKKKAPIIVELAGGLGNQLFQYALARKLAKINPDSPVYLSNFWYKQSAKHTYRQNKLANFHTTLPYASDDLVAQFVHRSGNILEKIYNKFRLNKKITLERFLKYDRKYLKIKSGYLRGYWQDERYFKDIRPVLLKELTLREKLPQKILQFIKKQRCLVSVHVRRGDYLHKKYLKYHGICGLGYYQNALNYFQKKVKSPYFLIFTDDVVWCKENLKNINCFYAADFGLTDCQELVLMSKCRHNILANSSFSWWGAWLNPRKDKIVIAPRRWFANQKMQRNQEIVPGGWLKI